MASYPGSIKNFLTLVDGVDRIIAAHPNDRAAEITAIETELGTDVAGSASDLKTRLAVVLENSGALKADSVITTTIKTTMSAISSAADALMTLPGGTYGFYPQLKGSSASANYQAYLAGSSVGWATLSTSYATLIQFRVQGGVTIYAQQRYVTASGVDMWIFLLLDKTTKNIISIWQAPDHPSYGNGGDPNILPHPFLSYDSDKHEIVLLDKDTCNKLKEEATKDRDIVTLINEDYKVMLSSIEEYKPLHSGRFLNKKLIMIDTIPDYITVRKLAKLSNQEMLKRYEDMKIKIAELKERNNNENNLIISAKNKLRTILTDAEIGALIK